MTTEYISVTDTAAVVKTKLSKHFVGYKFSVRSNSYSGGASIDVSWLDGPSPDEVESVVKQFEGATMDSSQDMKVSKIATYNGKQVRWGADFIFTIRSFSKEFMREMAIEVATKYGLDVPEIKVDTYTVKGKTTERPYIEYTSLVAGTNNTLGELIYREMRERSLYSSPNKSVPIPVSQFNAIVTENHEKGGIEIRFHTKPSADVINSLKVNRFHWSRFNSCWYSKCTPQTIEFADSLVSDKQTPQVNTVAIEELNPLDIKPAYLNIPPSFMEGQFPNTNKNDAVTECKEQISSGKFYIELCYVEEFVLLSEKEYDYFAGHLLTTYSWLDGKGGNGTTTPVEREVKSFYEYTEAEQEQYRKGLYTKCVAVVAPNREAILVDPQGYSYARYIAFTDQKEFDCLLDKYSTATPESKLPVIVLQTFGKCQLKVKLFSSRAEVYETTFDDGVLSVNHYFNVEIDSELTKPELITLQKAAINLYCFKHNKQFDASLDRLHCSW